jgi:hypothetical protein
LGKGAQTDTTICTGQTGWVCDGNNAVDCGATTPFYVDCTARGGTCAPYTGDHGGIPPCQLDANPCSDTDDLYHCEGANGLYACINSVRYGVDCTKWSAYCTDTDPATGALCTYTPASTCTTDGTTCDGAKLKYCQGGSQWVYDCEGAGLSCAVASTGDAYCAAPSCSESDYTACQESCDGDNLVLCIGGANVTVPCSKFGFSTCATRTVGTAQSPYCTGTGTGTTTNTEDSCATANNYVCDASCPPGTDTTDCAVLGDNSCTYAFDGTCDEPTLCATGTDSYDCYVFGPAAP